MNSINNLDEMMTKEMLKAEQQIKLRSNLHPWSPTLANAILELHLWKIITPEIKKNKTNKQIKIEMIIEKQKKYSPTIDITNIERINITIIKQNLQKTKKQLRIVQNKAKQY